MRTALFAMVALALVPAVAGHGDQSSLIGEWTLAPGETLDFERSIHWHRVMGQLEADADIVFVANGDIVAGPATSLTINHLVKCCDAVWSDVPFAIQNVGNAPATVRGDVAFLHDNLAVVAHNAEGGAGIQTLMIFALVIGIPALRAHRQITEPVGRWLLASRILHGGAWAVALTLALIGMVRFGGGPLVGSLGATAWFPSGLGQFLNTHSLVMLGLMALWGASYACLAGARRRGANAMIDGHLFVAGALAVGVAMRLEVGGFAQVVLVSAVPALLTLTDLHAGKLYTVWTRRLSPRGG